MKKRIRKKKGSLFSPLHNIPTVIYGPPGMMFDKKRIERLKEKADKLVGKTASEVKDK